MSKDYKPPQAFTNEPRPQIVLNAVDSSQVKAIGYDEETKTLAVQFKYGAGAIYHYADVSKETFDAFVSAESIGSFFGKNIKQLAFKKYVNDQVATPATV